MAIIDLQRSLRRLGKIRMGDQQRTQNGKMRPAKLTTWRITSPTLDLLRSAASIYGGEPRKWEGAPGEGEQFELYTESATLDVMIPPGPKVCDNWYETWSAGGCQKRCDGATDIINNTPCSCPADHEQRADLAKTGKACKLTTRLSVILPRVPDIGTWMLESHGYYAAVELAGSIDVIRLAVGDRLVPANLTMQPRTSKKRGETLRYVVPIIELPTLSAGALMTGEAPALPMIEPAPKAQLSQARAALSSGGGRAEGPVTSEAPPARASDDDDPGRPFTEDDEKLAGTEWVRSFAIECRKLGYSDDQRHAIVHRATRGRTSSSKAVRKDDLDRLDAVWEALLDNKLMFSGEGADVRCVLVEEGE